MKRFLLILAAISVLFLAGCNANKEVNNNITENNDNQNNENIVKSGESNLGEMEEKEEANTDVETETKYYEGVPEEIITANHESILGYAIKYIPDTFKVKSENGKDIFYMENNDNISVTIEKFETSYDDMIASLDSYKVSEDGTIYTEKTEGLFIGNIEICNYIKTNDGFFTIKSIYPYSSEYIEGIGTSIAHMIQSFKIK